LKVRWYRSWLTRSGSPMRTARTPVSVTYVIMLYKVVFMLALCCYDIIFMHLAPH
jgi:antibiotic biosynthesis monooxygenase (ABM) superfamily enzyme